MKRYYKLSINRQAARETWSGYTMRIFNPMTCLLTLLLPSLTLLPYSCTVRVFSLPDFYCFQEIAVSNYKLQMFLLAIKLNGIYSRKGAKAAK